MPEDIAVLHPRHEAAEKMQVRAADRTAVTFTMASRGCSMRGSETSSHRISFLPCQQSAFMNPPEANEPCEASRAPVALCAGMAALAALAGCAGMPENMAAPPLPTAVRVPAGHRHALTLKSVGTLNYECRARAGMSGAYGWVLDAPDAALLHWSGLRVGRYYAGPTLEYRDGSRITLKLVGSSPDDPGRLPLQLYEAATRRGEGQFSAVTYVQRLNGVTAEPAQPCTEARVGRSYKAEFSADFLFYRPK